MSDKIEEAKINDYKWRILNNPKRIGEEKSVIQEYGDLFNPANLDKLTKEDFKSFLLIKNNHHWEGIHRQSNLITSDMGKLRKGLKILLDENKSIEERLDFLFPPNGTNYIKGLGRAIITPILLVVYPDKYGVYNSKSEEGLRRMGLLPNFKSKDSFVDKYIRVNEILKELAFKYQITLWQLDEIVGWISLGNPPIGVDREENEITPPETEEKIENYEDFGLESHLEDFLVENWEKLEFGKNYSILEEDGDVVGQQYITPIGRIDILAKSKDNKEWLIIELKKGRIGDQVVGQLLRYIGWIKKNKAGNGEKVKGLIIVGEKDDKLTYSVSAVDTIELMTYSVSFRLNK